MKYPAHPLIESLEMRRLLSIAPAAVNVKMVLGQSPTINSTTETLNANGYLPRDVQVNWSATRGDYYWVFYTDTSNYYNPRSPRLHIQTQYGSYHLAPSQNPGGKSSVKMSIQIPIDQLSGPGISSTESRYDASGTANGPNTQIYYFTVVATATDVAPTFDTKGHVSAGAFPYGQEVCAPQIFLIAGLGDGDAVYNPPQTPQSPVAQSVACYMDAFFDDQTTTFADGDANIAAEIQNEIGDNTKFPLILAGQSYGGGAAVGMSYSLKSMGIPIQYLDLFDPVGQGHTPPGPNGGGEQRRPLPPGNAVYDRNVPYPYSVFTLPPAEISQADDWYFLAPDEGGVDTGYISSESPAPFHNYEGSAYGHTIPIPGSRHRQGVHMSQTYNSTVDAQIQDQLNAVNWAS